jgi:hypothetical protein
MCNVNHVLPLDPSEAETPHNVVKNRLASAPAMYPTGFPSAPPVSPQGNDGTFVRPNAARTRSLSNAETSSTMKEKSKMVRADSMENKLKLRRSVLLCVSSLLLMMKFSELPLVPRRRCQLTTFSLMSFSTAMPESY